MSGGTRGLMLAVASWAILGGMTRAADIETRDFAVLVADKGCGEAHLTIQKEKDGAFTVRTDTDIKVTVLLSSYKYSFRGTETWKGQRLTQLASNTDDNGKRYLVSAMAEAKGLKVKANNVERAIKAEAWTSTFWSLPDPKLREGELTVLDSDDGKDFTGKLAFVASEKHRVAGQEVALNHYRFTGKVTVDLWYDGHDRLVRREWTEMGKKMAMVLVRVRR